MKYYGTISDPKDMVTKEYVDSATGSVVVNAYPISGATEYSSTWLSYTSGGSALTPSENELYVLMAGSETCGINSILRWNGSEYKIVSDDGVIKGDYSSSTKVRLTWQGNRLDPSQDVYRLYLENDGTLKSEVSGTTVAEYAKTTDIPVLPTIETLTFTRTANNYVNDTSFNRIAGYKYGKIGVINFNLQMTANMPTATALLEIGTLSGATPIQEFQATIPAQSNNSTIMITISTSGSIKVGNYSGTATGTSFFRAMLPIIFS